MSATNENGLTLREWEQLVDDEVSAICGLTADCLGDYNSTEEWAEGASPKDSAIMLLEEEGYPFDA